MDRKSELLGMPVGTAQHRLRKMILFSLLVKHKENVCFRCGQVIDTVDDLSVEHMKPWASVDDPNLFWNLDNIAFSHLQCNKPVNVGRGERCATSKLTEVDVIAIRNSDISVTKIAKTYNVDRSTIYNVKNGKHWKHV